MAGVRARGFTPMQLTIAVMILGILVAAVYLLLTKLTITARRSEAQELMTVVSVRQAELLRAAHQYSPAIGNAGLRIALNGWTCAAGCVNPYYTVSMTVNNAATPPNYTISATPVAGSSQERDGKLTLDSTGAKSGNW